MTTSKIQKIATERTCACGCNMTFFPFPVYSPASRNIESYVVIDGERGGILYVPKYIRGHHPNKNKDRVAWNKGLTKSTCPILSKMGFQKGHQPFNDWSHVIKLQREDPEYRTRWIQSKKGQVPWNKGKTKHQYPNGIKNGVDHGNWRGGNRGIYDSAEYKAFSKLILKRDNYTCQKCGDRNQKGRGSRCALECHHIVAIAENHELAFEPTNAITLCHNCHVKTENYGTKLVHKRRKQGGSERTELSDG